MRKMAGQNIFTTVGRDAIAEHLKCGMAKFRLGEGGFVKSALVTEVIDASSTGLQKIYTYTVTGGTFSIIGVSQGAKTFTVLGDKVSLLATGARIRVVDSTANNGLYTVVSATLNVSDTDVVVEEVIPDATVDGDLFIDRLPICKGPAESALHHVTAVIEYNGVTPVQKLEDTTGTGVLTQTLGGTLGAGLLNYKTGVLLATFEDYPTVGNQIVVEYKYANVPKTPVGSKIELESEGDSLLFTVEKALVDGNFQLRGPGYGTLRVTLQLTQSEGLDDGQAEAGGTPFYFEGGIYDSDDVLLIYFTFDKEKKLGSTTITHTVDLVV